MTQYKIARTDREVYYALETLTSAQADDAGCPGSTHKITGRHGYVIGTITSVTGRIVTVPGWSTRKGYLATFTPWNGQGETTRGYVTTN